MMLWNYGGSSGASNNYGKPVLITGHVIAPLYDYQGDVYAHAHTIGIEGFVEPDDGLSGNAAQSSLTAKINAINDLYAEGNKDASFKQSGGSNSSHTLLTAGSINGTRPSAVEWVNTEGVEYALRRTYRVSISAEYEVTGDPLPVIRYEDSIDRIGNGGPRTIVKETVNSVVDHQVTASTKIIYRHSGISVRRDGFQAVPILGGFSGAVFDSEAYRTQDRISRDRFGAPVYIRSWSKVYYSTSSLSVMPTSVTA